MKTNVFISALLIFFNISIYAQEEPTDTINLNEIIINATRTDVPLKQIPAAVSVVNATQMNSFQKTIAVDEALRLVPGIKVDNGTGGSRVHLYIRGQGVLSERGFRGIQVLIDGIPVNDPGGYCPDLYDVDWKTVQRVEVVKGLAASTYGGAATGGVVNIITSNGGEKPFGGMLYTTVGSYGFWKTLGQFDGTQGNVNYRMSYSHNQGNGYRIHQAFLGDNFSEKITWKPSEKITVTQLLTYTNYFNQNSEGINLDRYETFGPQAANTDAIPWNEFQQTKRLTGAGIVKYTVNEKQDFQLKGFVRLNSYRETSNRADDYRPYTNPGFSAQYNIHQGADKVKNTLSLGGDYYYEAMNIHNYGVDGMDTIRVDTHFGKTCFDSDVIQINENIYQKSAGGFLIDRLDINQKLFATLNVRYDYIYSQLVDNLNRDSLNLSGSKEYQKPTYRFGLAYDISPKCNVYANYGTGYLAPSNDELFNNPSSWGGFNAGIKPSESQGAELGFRGDIKKKLHYNITGFMTNTSNDFYRFRVAWMGNTSDVYGNIGKSARKGVETYLSLSPCKNTLLEVAYMYSDFRYVSPDSVKDHFIPECPQHILDADISYKITKYLTF
ncbi:MAG: TonB-dependent receptor, partial [Bacteroidetes bacterium]|nr:TonB-dependent receptor [Bacteroidota bacterium]